jgi:ketosteroid isomerase-like protein
MSTGMPSFFGAHAKSVFRSRPANLFYHYQMTLIVTIIAIRVSGDTAFDYGWHNLTLVPRHGGEPIATGQRYFERWRRSSSGEWKIDLYIDNSDVAPMMPDAESPIPEASCPPDTPMRRESSISKSNRVG